jgi:hypothetical protein
VGTSSRMGDRCRRPRLSLHPEHVRKELSAGSFVRALRYSYLLVVSRELCGGGRLHFPKTLLMLLIYPNGRVVLGHWHSCKAGTMTGPEML